MPTYASVTTVVAPGPPTKRIDTAVEGGCAARVPSPVPLTAETVDRTGRRSRVGRPAWVISQGQVPDGHRHSVGSATMGHPERGVPFPLHAGRGCPAAGSAGDPRAFAPVRAARPAQRATVVARTPNISAASRGVRTGREGSCPRRWRGVTWRPSAVANSVFREVRGWIAPRGPPRRQTWAVATTFAIIVAALAISDARQNGSSHDQYHMRAPTPSGRHVTTSESIPLLGAAAYT